MIVLSVMVLRTGSSARGAVIKNVELYTMFNVYTFWPYE